MYIVPDKVILYVLPLCFQEDSFFDPPHWLPPFELYNDLVGVDGLYQIEEDVSLDGVACEVERLINLDESAWHYKRYINLIISCIYSSSHNSNNIVTNLFIYFLCSL